MSLGRFSELCLGMGIEKNFAILISLSKSLINSIPYQFSYRFSLGSHWLTTWSHHHAKQHMKDIAIVQINSMLRGQCLGMLEIFQLFVVIGVGVTAQKSNYMHIKLLLKVMP